MLIALYASFNAFLTLIFINVYKKHLFGKLQLVKELFGLKSKKETRSISINAISPVSARSF
jgi:hypothetical protein